MRRGQSMGSFKKISWNLITGLLFPLFIFGLLNPNLVYSKYTVRMSNVDDLATLYINGQPLYKAQWGYYGTEPTWYYVAHQPGDSGEFEITNDLVSGDNSLRFTLWNQQGCCDAALSIEVKKDGAIIFSDSIDISDSSEGIKYDKTFMLTVSGGPTTTTVPIAIDWGKYPSIWTGDQSGPSDSSGRYWNDPDYDDSSWVNITLPDTGQDNSIDDRYYRKHFNWDGQSDVIVKMYSDDGLSICINGNIFGSWGYGWRNGGCVNNPQDSCSQSVNVPDQTIPKSMLKTGDNLLAVDLWNGDFPLYYLSIDITSTYNASSTTTTTTAPAINPTIAQTPMSGPPGTLFTQRGTGFTTNSTATLHFKKPDGSEYPTQQQPINSTGHFAITYTAPMDKPPGIYAWWAIDGPTGIKSNEVSYEITNNPDACNPPKSVNVNNTNAYGLYEGSITNTKESGDATTVDIDLEGTKSPLPVIGGSTHFWTTIDVIPFDSACVKEFGANPDDAVGSEWADIRIIPPGTRASFRASFCKAGAITFKLESFSSIAILFTMADILLTDLGAPIDDIDSFVNDISNPDDFPSINSAMVHIKNAADAASRKKIGIASIELFKAGRDIRTISLNSTEFKKLLVVLGKSGIDVTVPKLFPAIFKSAADIISIFTDIIVYSIQTGCNLKQVEIEIIAQ